MKIGIVFGCFIPMHQGHISLIEKALKENDKIILGICGFDDDRGKDFIPFKDRIRLVTDAFGADDRIIFSVVNDKKIGLTGKFDLQSWNIWCEELFKNARIDPEDSSITFTWYSGDTDYLRKIEYLYPEHEFCLLDRSIIALSGTQIRENPEDHDDDIHPLFKKYLVDKGILSSQ